MIIESIKEFKSDKNRILAFDGENSLSYSEFWEHSESVACELITNYHTKNPVAIFGDKENDMISCVYGALKAGKPFICITSYYPKNRITEIIEDSCADVILCPAENIKPETALDVIDITAICSKAPFAVGPENYTKPGDIAAMLYTSGSTGKPKGIILSYENLLSKHEYCEQLLARYTDKKDIVDLNLASYSFSASLGTLIRSATDGSTICTVSKSMLLDTESLVDFFIKTNPYYVTITPSLAEKLIANDRFTEENIPNMKAICLGGEPLSINLARRIRDRLPHVGIDNGYGTTETCGSGGVCGITDDLLNGNERFLPIAMIERDTMYLVDSDGNRITEDNIKGEIIIYGDSVTAGYLNRPELTEKAYFTDENGNRAFRTRDNGFLKNGYIYYLGREDNQVKIGGNRIELEDVEANIRRMDSIKECAVTVYTDEEEINRLIAYIVREDNSIPKMKSFLEIKQFLKNYVQNYMIPSKLVFVDSLPKNMNMKIDRNKLKEMAKYN